LAALGDLDRRFRAHAVGLPQREKEPDAWAGLLFRIGQVAVVSELGEIAEVLEFPRDVTPVPATKAWVRGVANNRGTLLPVFDLCGLLFDVPTARNPRNRVLVVRDAEVPFGLLVGYVTGIRRLNAAALRREVPDVHAGIRSLIVGGCLIGREGYPVFSLPRMAQDARLKWAAA
jgi:twitching motility protein PilI